MRRKWGLVFTLAVLGGAALHFLYDVWPNPLTAVLAPVNESVWEHLKLFFWPTLAALFGEETPKTVEEKRSLALRHGVALWDTIGSCEIAGSSDASITNVVPNDLRVILDAADIRAVFCNGGTSYDSYNRCCRALAGREAVKLPSTSPANARWTQEKLLKAWRKALGPYLSIV